MKSSVIAFEREMEKEYYAAGSLCCCFLKQANVLTIHLRLYDYFYNIIFGSYSATCSADCVGCQCCDVCSLVCQCGMCVEFYGQFCCAN